MQDDQRSDSSNEWTDREIGARPRCAEPAQRRHKEHQTQPVAEKTKQQRTAYSAGRREVRAERERDRDIDSAGDQSLQHCDSKRIGRRNFLGQIVVDPPTKTSG